VQPVVSIVTPCLNPGDRLVRCLDSVASQTYPHVEHIVIDGGSTDGTVDLLIARGVRFVSEPDRGQTNALNKGFALATGVWLTWLNADDVLDVHALELLVAGVAATPEAGWVYADLDLVDGEWRETYRSPAGPITPELLDEGNVVPQQGTLIARWALDRVGPLDEGFHLAMDFDLWLRLAVAGVASVHIPETLAVFEIHPDSKTGMSPSSDFRFEEAVALMKAGRRRPGVRMLGRAAGSASWTGTGPIARSELDREVESALAAAAGRGVPADPSAVRAAAYAYAALHELHLRPRSLQYLRRPEPWLGRESRGLLARALTQRIARRLKRES
jgi:hypothetical protein